MPTSSRQPTRGPRALRAPATPREPLPAIVEPMAALTSAHLPKDPEQWSFEYKWDGVRAIARFDGRNLNLYSRNLLNISPAYPELQPLASALDGHQVMLDGEIIAVDDADRPSFPLLQRRMHVRSPSPRLVADVPVYYVIFDLLHLDGRSTLKLPLLQRRALLEQLTLAGPSWRVSPASLGQGQLLLDTATQNHLEGVMAKRADSFYEPGRRSANWLKIKLAHRQEFVVGGWSPQLDRPDVLGTLQVGYYESPGKSRLHYAGSVGTGFDAATRAKLLSTLTRLESDASPFLEPLPRKDVHFTVPALVVEVEYRRWPQDGLIQQASFKGTRRDKPAREVVKECPL